MEGHLTPKVEAELQRAGFLPGARLPPHAWKRVLELAARALRPGDTPTHAQAHLAERLLQEARRTPWGRPMFLMLRLMGPRRALERLAQTLGPSVRLVPEETGAGHLLYLPRVAVSPAFTEALLRAGLQALGAPHLEVHHRGNAREGHTFVARWD